MGKNSKIMAAILSLVMMLTALSGCSGTAAENATSPAGEQMSSAITIEADDWQITIENTKGKTVRQLLEEADIVLEEADVLSVDPEQIPYDGMTIQVLRRHTVTVSSVEDGSSIRIILLGGTVADALEAAGIELTDQQMVNYQLDQPLEDSMEIAVSAKEEETTTTTTVTTVTETTETTTVTTTAAENPGNKPAATNKTTTKATTKTKPATTTTKPAATTTKPVTQTTTTTPAATEAERTIVSIEIYEDCDGSGHGVKVITYSDGTQEEVPF